MMGANSAIFYGNNILKMFLNGSYHIVTSLALKIEGVNATKISYKIVRDAML
jgi:hypothetical protein